MFIQSQTSDLDVVGDDVPSNMTRTVCDLPGLPSVFESRRRFRAKEDVSTLGRDKGKSELIVVG